LEGDELSVCVYVEMYDRISMRVIGATFDESGKFTRRTHLTNHARGDHVNPHYHDADSPNGTGKNPGIPINKFYY